MYDKVFDRIEKKYLITEIEKNRLIKTIKKYMKKDGYFRSTVSNLYFDNDNYDLITQSIDHPKFKEKMRARSYEGYNRVFLEIKTKLKGEELNLGYKRRIMLSRKDFNEFIKRGTPILSLVSQNAGTQRDIQIAKEIDYLISHFNLKPKILIIYDRESYKGEDELRITFDENLSFRDKNLSLIKGGRDKIYFKNKRNIIMEIKAHGIIPLWLADVMTKERVFPQQFSKVGKVYEELINKKGKNV